MIAVCFCIFRYIEEHPELIRMLKDDVCRGNAESNFGRQDVPSVEQYEQHSDIIVKGQREVQFGHLGEPVRRPLRLGSSPTAQAVRAFR
ncbi:MAG: hypothetical protein LBT01_03670 [Spirochaetaceae bacterium]|jgi:hypothetical protein|nr:hypothetical protein [Spirochaetaceae bacterium]